ncbi:MAG TPA: glycosyltransferase family 39 protein [Planctomycetota bacterium]|nr:glycosyltransferase family 39 protein [Planctomycetota bacterium]
MSRTEKLALATALFLGALFVADHDAWTPDEPRVVALAKSISRDSWVAPRLNGEPFLEQPPLHAWCVALAYRALGESVTVARCVSVLFSLATLAVTFLMGARLANRDVGALAAILLATSGLFFWGEHRVTTDPPLAFFVAVSAYASLRAFTTGSARERFLALFCVYLGASLAYLSKGVVGIGLSGFAFLAVIAAQRAPRKILQGHLWLAPLVFALVTGFYHYRLHEDLGLDALKTVVWENTYKRSATDDSHAQNVAYYVWSFPLHFLPATLFLLAGLQLWLKRRRTLDERERLAWEFPLIWLGLGLLGLSCASSKREIYVLSLLPAGALVGALWLEKLPAFQRPLARILVGALALLVVADLVAVPRIDKEKSLGPGVRDVVAHVPSDRVLYAINPDETTYGTFNFYADRGIAPLPSRTGVKDVLELAKTELLLHLEAEGELYVVAVEKRKGDVIFHSLEDLAPEVLAEEKASRTLRLLRFRRR